MESDIRSSNLLSNGNEKANGKLMFGGGAKGWPGVKTAPQGHPS